jgi:hypothetical protein
MRKQPVKSTYTVAVIRSSLTLLDPPTLLDGKPT